MRSVKTVPEPAAGKLCKSSAKLVHSFRAAASSTGPVMGTGLSALFISTALKPKPECGAGLFEACEGFEEEVFEEFEASC